MKSAWLAMVRMVMGGTQAERRLLAHVEWVMFQQRFASWKVAA